MPTLDNTVIVSISDNHSDQAVTIKRAAKNSSLSALAEGKIKERRGYEELSAISTMEGKSTNYSLNGGMKGLKFAFSRIDKLTPGS